MAWKFPKRRIDLGDPAAVDAINDNFNEYSQESGSIDGHNFRADAISSQSDLASTAGLLITVSSKEVNHGIIDQDVAGIPDNTAGGVDNDIIGDTANAWASIDDLTVTVQTEDSPLWILASLQRLNSSDAAFAISVDGTVIPETIVGGATRDNDPYGFGPSTPNSPYAFDGIVSVAAGTHTVSVVARFFRRTSSAATTALMDTIQNRELIVIELRR
jgi:hypothetical protein